VWDDDDHDHEQHDHDDMTCAHDVNVHLADGRVLTEVDDVGRELGQALIAAAVEAARAVLVGQPVIVVFPARCILCAAECVLEATLTIGAADPVDMRLAVLQ
jgi:hypothetical protein